MKQAIYNKKIDKYDSSTQQLRPQLSVMPIKPVRGYITTLEKTEKDNIFKIKRVRLKDLNQ